MGIGLVRRAPARLLDRLEGQCFRSLRHNRANIDVDEGPAMFTGDFAAEPVDIIVVAFDLDHVRLINQVAETLAASRSAGMNT